MREQLQALATYCEERWVGKIGRQELSFGVSNEEASEVQAAGVRRPQSTQCGVTQAGGPTVVGVSEDE